MKKFEQLEQFVLRHLSSILVVVVASASIFAFLWHRYEAVLERSEQNDAKYLQLEKRDLQLQKRNFILDQRETLLQQREKNLALQTVLLEQNGRKNASALAQLQREQSNLSAQARRNKREDEMLQLMKELADMGITSSPYCDDVEGVRRYNAATAKYRAIISIAFANGLFEKYRLDGGWGSGLGNHCIERLEK